MSLKSIKQKSTLALCIISFCALTSCDKTKGAINDLTAINNQIKELQENVASMKAEIEELREQMEQTKRALTAEEQAIQRIYE